MDEKIYLVKLKNGDTLLFRGWLDQTVSALRATGTVYLMTIEFNPMGGPPTIVPTPNWMLGAEINDLILGLTDTYYYTDKVPKALADSYLAALSGIVRASAGDIPKSKLVGIN